MLTKEEAQALLQIISRAKFEGMEVMSVAQLIQKLNSILEEAAQPKEVAPLKKKIN